MNENKVGEDAVDRLCIALRLGLVICLQKYFLGSCVLTVKHESINDVTELFCVYRHIEPLRPNRSG